MRSEKEQMIVGKEKSVVEIQFREIPGEQENACGNTKQKEEKKEVFTKVGIECWLCRSEKQKWTEVSAPRTATNSNDATASQMWNSFTYEKHRNQPCVQSAV